MAAEWLDADPYAQALVALGHERDDIVVLDADFSRVTGTAVFARHFPERFFNVGIAEQNMLGIAAGLAEAGLVPFATSIAAFAVRQPYDQIYNLLGCSRLNVKLVGAWSGLSLSTEGASHHALEDIGLMRMIPTMTVVVPADRAQTYHAVKRAAVWDGPVYLRLKPGLHLPSGDADSAFEIGPAYVLASGTDVAIVATGAMVAEALAARQALAREGVEAAVVNVATIKPLDSDTVLAVAARAAGVVVAEEHNICGGLGSAVAQLLAERCPRPMVFIGVRDRFGQSAPRPEQLWATYGLNAREIARAALKLLGVRPPEPVASRAEAS